MLLFFVCDNIVDFPHLDSVNVLIITNVLKHEVIYPTMSAWIVPKIWIKILVKTVMMKSEKKLHYAVVVAQYTVKMFQLIVSDVHRLIMFAGINFVVQLYIPLCFPIAIQYNLSHHPLVAWDKKIYCFCNCYNPSQANLFIVWPLFLK